MLSRCLESLRAALSPDDEVIVVDSASEDARSVARVVEASKFELLRCERKGTSRARNAGWRAAHHPLVAFVDDDVWVDRGWADALVERFSADAALGFVCGRVEPPEREHSHHVSTKQDLDPATFDRTSKGLIGHSANLTVRRSVLGEVGGFDVEMGPGARFRAAEDGDLFDRLLRRGNVGAYEPSALAWHDQWRSKQDLVRLHFGYGVGAGAQVAKLLRTDSVRFRLVALGYGRWCARDAWSGIRERYKLVMAMCVVRTAGLATGFVLGLTHGVVDGHYRSRVREGRAES